MRSGDQQTLLGGIIEIDRRLTDERQLAAATIASIGPAGARRFCQSAAKKKFQPLYRSLLERFRGLAPDFGITAECSPASRRSPLRRMSRSSSPKTRSSSRCSRS